MSIKKLKRLSKKYNCNVYFEFNGMNSKYWAVVGEKTTDYYYPIDYEFCNDIAKIKLEEDIEKLKSGVVNKNEKR